LKRDIYIFSSGELKRKDNTLFFESETGRKYIPVEGTDNIWVFGEVSFNKHFLDFASQKEICIHFFNYYGYYSGSYYPREHLNSGHVILKQAEYYSDSKKRLDLAKRIVRASIKNMTVVLRYYNSRGVELGASIERINDFHEKASSCETIDELMAYEGNSRDMYYSEFKNIINNPDFEFTKRSRRPPRDRINTLISFGNSVLYTAVLGEIYKTYLDPRIGYLHTTNARRFSLNLDIADVFKPVLVDRVIFTLLNKSIITKKDFISELGGIVLKDDARKRFIEEFNNKLESVIKHPKLNMNVSYRRLIRMELYKIQKHILVDETYEGFVARW
jgi:CRISPR-associated protein Cas1